MNSIGTFEIFKLDENNNKILLDKVENKVSLDFLRIILGMDGFTAAKLFKKYISEYNTESGKFILDQIGDEAYNYLNKTIFDICFINLLNLTNAEANDKYNKLNNLRDVYNELFYFAANRDLRYNYMYRMNCDIIYNGKIISPIYTYKAARVYDKSDGDWYNINYNFDNIIPYQIADEYRWSASPVISKDMVVNSLEVKFGRIPLNLAKLNSPLEFKKNDKIFITYSIKINKSKAPPLSYNGTNINFNLINNSHYRLSLNYASLYNFKGNIKHINDADFAKYTDESLYNCPYLQIYPTFYQTDKINIDPNFINRISVVNDIYTRNYHQNIVIFNNSSCVITSLKKYTKNNSSESINFKNSIFNIENIFFKSPKVEEMEIYYSINNDEKYEFEINKKHTYRKCTMEDFLFWKKNSKKLPGVVVRDINLNKTDGEIKSIKFFVKQQVKFMDFEDSSVMLDTYYGGADRKNASFIPDYEMNSSNYDVYFEYTFLPVLNFEEPYTVYGVSETLPSFYHGFITDDTRNI